MCEFGFGISDCYESFKLPTEMHLNWARPGTVQVIRDGEYPPLPE